MGEEKGSKFVYIFIILLGLAALGFAIAGERHRGSGTLYTDAFGRTYCHYDTDAATGFGIAASVLLLISQAFVMGVTRCLCCARHLARGGCRVGAIALCISSWIAYIIADACLVSASAYDRTYRISHSEVEAHDGSCSSVRKFMFIGGAVFGVITTILDILYYNCFVRARVKYAHQPHPAIGMPVYGQN